MELWAIPSTLADTNGRVRIWLVEMALIGPAVGDYGVGESSGVGGNGVGVDVGELWKRLMRTEPSAGFFDFLDQGPTVAEDARSEAGRLQNVIGVFFSALQSRDRH